MLVSNRTDNIHLYIWRTSHSSTSGLASISDVHQMIWLVEQQHSQQSGLCIHPFHIKPPHLREIRLSKIQWKWLVRNSRTLRVESKCVCDAVSDLLLLLLIQAHYLLLVSACWHFLQWIWGWVDVSPNSSPLWDKSRIFQFQRFMWLYLIMGQHVQSLPVCFDLCGDILILQDHALSSTLAPLCNQKKDVHAINVILLLPQLTLRVISTDWKNCSFWRPEHQSSATFHFN